MRQSRCAITKNIGLKSNRNFGVNGFGQEAIVFCQSEMGLIQKQSRNISKISVHRANARSAIHPHSHEWGISRILLNEINLC